MKRSTLCVSLAVMLMLSSYVSGAMFLQNFYSRAVNVGYSVPTSIDSMELDMKVNSGIAVSKYSFVLTPGAMQQTAFGIRLVEVDTVETGGKIVEPVEEIVEVLSDSIEMRMSFRLPSDFVADSMWLWIDGKRVPAYIQDRALASQQYNQIVGVRRDPALLETWGNGSYSLRIFPASSHKSRKIEIQFHHTFDDDDIYGAKGLIAASIPVTFNPVGTNAENTVAVKAMFSAVGTDGVFNVDFPGVGTGTFSAGSPLTLQNADVAKIDSGAVTADDPSGSDEFLWVGFEPQSDQLEVGTSIDFSEDQMRFENEPDTRIILIDVRNAVWDWNTYYNQQSEMLGRKTNYTSYELYNVWQRAQKYAVLAVQQYLKEGHKFNLIVGGDKNTAAFTEPVETTDENIQVALELLVNAEPSAESNTLALMKTALAQAPDGIVVLISDIFRPADYQIILDGATTSRYEISEAGKAFDAEMALLDSIVTASRITLFTINDYYMISQLALKTGGFNLGGILNRYNIAFRYEVIEGVRVRFPILPDLFGSSNGSGLRHLSITADGITDMVYTIDNNYASYYYTRGLVMDDEMVMAKTQVAIAPTYYSNYLRTGTMRIAGHAGLEKSGEPVTVTITGKLDGLWFSRKVTATGSYSSVSAYTPFTDPQWAFRKASQLAFNDYINNAAEIKKIGKEYHIVTRQTSLLALEPGMELFEDTAWENQVAKSNDAAAPAAGMEMSSREASVYSQADMVTTGGASNTPTGSGVDFDGVTLENLLRKNKIAVTVPKKISGVKFSAKAAGMNIRLTMPLEQIGNGVTLRLFDLKGRLVATRQLTVKDFHGSTTQWNLSGRSAVAGRGIYTVQVNGIGVNKVFRITLIGK